VFQRQRDQIVDGVLVGRMVHHGSNTTGGLNQSPFVGSQHKRNIMVHLWAASVHGRPRQRRLVAEVPAQPGLDQA
jgi:hypothetical protein